MARILLSHEPGIRQYIHKSPHDTSKIALETEFDAEPVVEYATWLRHRVEAVARTKRKFPNHRVLGVIPRAMYFSPQYKMWEWTDRDWAKFWTDSANRMLVVEPYLTGRT